MRCPLCGDSQKNTKKARGYIFKGKQDRFFFKCYNCNEVLSFDKFLARVDPSLHSSYMTDRFRETVTTPKTSKPIEEEIEVPKSLFTIDKLGQYCEEIRNLPKNHFAYQYLIQRDIPSQIIESELFYTGDFKTMAESILSSTGLGMSKETYAKMRAGDQRIIIPFRNKNKEVTGFQGRSLNPNNPVKYITIKLDPHAPKIYGVDKLDLNKTIYVFEGPFDSMFIPNSVAVMDAALYRVIELLPNIQKKNLILVFDNEPRNPDIIRVMNEAIKQGFPIVIFGSELGSEFKKNKDINDLVSKGKIPSAILHDLIDRSTYSNSTNAERLRTQMALTLWKKVS